MNLHHTCYFFWNLTILSIFISVGQDPFIQVNSPHPLQPTNLNELAHNVVSTVKSGLFKAASNLFWGSSTQENDEPEKPPEDPERKLEIRYF